MPSCLAGGPSAVMQLGLGLGAGELDTDAVVAAPADFRPIGHAVDRNIEQEMIRDARFRRDFQFGAAGILIAQRTTDLGILDTGDDRPALSTR